MMDEIEQRLQEARLEPPSPKFEQRMAALFDIEQRRSMPRRYTWGYWLWLGLASLAGATTVFLVLMPSPRPAAAPPSVYRLPPEGRLRDMLLNVTVLSESDQAAARSSGN